VAVLQGQVTGDRPLFAPGEDVGEVIAGRQWPMEVLQVARLLAEAVIVISQESPAFSDSALYGAGAIRRARGCLGRGPR
jgi:hypothetical protein